MRGSRILKPLGSKGDTIIEVLLAIAIVSAVLGGAFVSANRSLSGTRVSQERSEATKLVQGQAELLGAFAKNADASSSIYTTNSGFHMNNLAVSNGALNSGIYQVAINREHDVVTNTDTFRIRATWTKVGSGTTEEMFIRYRVYPNP